MQHLHYLAFVFVLIHSVNMHRDAVQADSDLPLAALFRSIIIKHRELPCGLVPPIHLAIALIDVFSRHLLVIGLVVKSVGADDDLHILVIDCGVGGI